MAGSNGGSYYIDDHAKGKKLVKFICLEKCVISGAKDPMEVGTEVYADVSDWKLFNWLELFDGSDAATRYIGMVKNHTVIPFAKWRDRQIDSILSP